MTSFVLSLGLYLISVGDESQKACRDHLQSDLGAESTRVHNKYFWGLQPWPDVENTNVGAQSESQFIAGNWQSSWTASGAQISSRNPPSGLIEAAAERDARMNPTPDITRPFESPPRKPEN